MSTDNRAQQQAITSGSTGMSTSSGGEGQTEDTGSQEDTSGQSTGRTTGQVNQGDSRMPATFQGKLGVVGYSYTNNEAIVRPDKGLYAVGALTGKRYKRYGAFSAPTDEERATLEAGGWSVGTYPGLNR